MSDSWEEPSLYRVSYNGVARTSILDIINQGESLEDKQALLECVKEIDRRLHLYPQFGEPLQKSQSELSELWIAIVAPVVIHYYLSEAKRLVIVARPLQTLSTRRTS